MIGKMFILLIVCMFVNIVIVIAGSNNKEHVHIKLHVPELIKRHTHVRTVYKHHYKPKTEKSKKTIEPAHARLDPSIKIASIPNWMPKYPMYKPSTEHMNSDQEALMKGWQQHLNMLQPKKSKKSKKNHFKMLELMAEAAANHNDDDDDVDNDEQGSFNDFAIKKHNKGRQFSHLIPDYMAGLGNDEEGNGEIYASAPSIKSPRSNVHHFKKPHIMKITEDDIKTRAEQSNYQKWNFNDRDITPAKISTNYNWPSAIGASPYQPYSTITPQMQHELHQKALAELDEDEFMPSAQLTHINPSAAAASSNADYPNIFSINNNKPKMNMQPSLQTYTKYKNKLGMQNMMSNLNTRIN